MESEAVINSVLAFAAFCCLSSAVYIFNDLTDAKEDRFHPEKSNRPISSGELSVSLAAAWALILVAFAGCFGFLISWKFVAVEAIYVSLMFAYCLALKRMIVLDAMAIASGFVLRVVAGAAAVDVQATHWLIACTFLLALFLAFTKRRQELLVLSGGAADHRQVLNQYSVPYLENVNTILIGATIVCYALYTVAPETVSRFGTDSLIYGTVFVIYGMLRYLALINDPAKGGNPSKLLLKDTPLILTVAGWSVFNAATIYHAKFENILPNFIR